ncbi:Uncharacterized protein Adt_40475 [Abeliophyllum distichum]|uniref:Uncharacterized protein n=1 Tax=Abeliophyllum distichum TaxID=126358 RepID=A0ABD1Q805_9LAMI
MAFILMDYKFLLFFYYKEKGTDYASKSYQGFTNEASVGTQMVSAVPHPPMAKRAPQVSQAHQAPLTHHTSSAVLVIEQFYRYYPPTFNDGKDLLVAEELLRTIEKFFWHISCLDNHKVLCTEFMLIG